MWNIYYKQLNVSNVAEIQYNNDSALKAGVCYLLTY